MNAEIKKDLRDAHKAFAILLCISIIFLFICFGLLHLIVKTPIWSKVISIGICVGIIGAELVMHYRNINIIKARIPKLNNRSFELYGSPTLRPAKRINTQFINDDYSNEHYYENNEQRARAIADRFTSEYKIANPLD